VWVPILVCVLIFLADWFALDADCALDGQVAANRGVPELDRSDTVAFHSNVGIELRVFFKSAATCIYNGTYLLLIVYGERPLITARHSYTFGIRGFLFKMKSRLQLNSLCLR